MRTATTLALLPILLGSVVRAQNPSVEERLEDAGPPAVVRENNKFRFEGKDVAPNEFFRLTGREDLAEKSERNVRNRIILAATGAAVLVGAAIPGIMLVTSSPDTETPRCQSDYAYFNNVCLPQKAQHSTLGVVVLSVGGLLGFGLLTIAYWSLPEVLKPFALREYVSDYNKKRAAKAAGPQVHLTPIVTLNGGGMSLEARF